MESNMANDDARRQKRLAKQKAKRTEKRIKLARQSSNDPTIQLSRADRWPIVDLFVSEHLWTSGLGYAGIARKKPDGSIVCGIFMLDVFCLGIKDVFWATRTQSQYHELFEQMENKPRRDISPEYLCKLVHCCADYGQSLGFPPPGDFRHVRLLLSGIDPALCDEQFEFGRNGEPLYISGMNDSPEKARAITQRVNEIGGKFIVRTNSDLFVDGFSSGPGLLEDTDDDEFDEEEFDDR